MYGLQQTGQMERKQVMHLLELRKLLPFDRAIAA
jgi:hypothetical protein